MKINAVLGPIDVEGLGTTLIHEHLGIGQTGWKLDHQDFDRKKEGDKLKELRDKGLPVSLTPTP
ncbi:hypothetical protein A9Q88_01020 [Gammaproteobacteria bacterium 50_400_T64]|nr:hypothetical protein A9Q88_01020 [Gammaproteobacteria bacterium 50_400_T64]